MAAQPGFFDLSDRYEALSAAGGQLERLEFQIKDRLSFQRFLGLGLDGTVPDATTVWLFRERLVKAKAIDRLFARFDAALTDRGYFRLRRGMRLFHWRGAAAILSNNISPKKGEEPRGRLVERENVRQSDRASRSLGCL